MLCKYSVVWKDREYVYREHAKLLLQWCWWDNSCSNYTTAKEMGIVFGGLQHSLLPLFTSPGVAYDFSTTIKITTFLPAIYSHHLTSAYLFHSPLPLFLPEIKLTDHFIFSPFPTISFTCPSSPTRLSLLSPLLPLNLLKWVHYWYSILPHIGNLISWLFSFRPHSSRNW